MPVQPNPETGLTLRQQQVVTIGSDPALNAYADIAKKLGVRRQTVYEILSYPTVKAALESARQARLDKARAKSTGALAQLDRILPKLLNQIDEHAKTQLSPLETAGLLKTLTEVIPKLKDQLGLDDTADQDRQRYDWQRKRRHHWSIRIGAGMKILGFGLPPRVTGQMAGAIKRKQQETKKIVDVEPLD